MLSEDTFDLVISSIKSSIVEDYREEIAIYREIFGDA